jgi:(p)ppGpp synthase/HD superfamily hydrolase
MNMQRIWEATFTRRWHANPHMADTADPVGGHQGRVALLALMLFPREIAVLRAAVIHDMGEWATGDVPYPVKEANPDLKATLDLIEAAAMLDMGLPVISLDPVQSDMLRLCDRLDAMLWARHHKPHLMQQADWQHSLQTIIGLAWRLNVAHLVVPMVDGSVRF